MPSEARGHNTEAVWESLTQCQRNNVRLMAQLQAEQAARQEDQERHLARVAELLDVVDTLRGELARVNDTASARTSLARRHAQAALALRSALKGLFDASRGVVDSRADCWCDFTFAKALQVAGEVLRASAGMSSE